MQDSFSSDVRDVCEFVAGLSWSDLPPEVQQRAMDVLADDLSAMAAGSREPELRRYADCVLARSAGGQSMLVAPGLPAASLLDAASWNALSGNWCELDEGFRLAICHAGIYTLPALVAEATMSGAPLRRVLLALAGAYELVTRCAMSFHAMPPPVHGHALWSSVGAAAAISLLRGYPAQKLFMAVSGAATTASMGPRSHLMSGVLIRNGWAAAGAVNGIQCSDWADAGIGGSASSLQEVMCGIVGAELRQGVVADKLGERWSLMHGYQKLYSCCQQGHSAVQACLELQRQFDLPSSRIKHIRLATHPLALTLTTMHPETTLGARFSMPHMVAAALVRRSGSVSAFASDTLHDAEIRSLREKVVMSLASQPMEPPHDRPAWIEIELDGGRVIRGQCLSSTGSPDNPMSRDAFREKLSELSAGVLPLLHTAIEPDHYNGHLDTAFDAWLKALA